MVALESSRLFENLAEGDFVKLREVARELTFTEGQTIFQEGDRGDGLYVVKDGVVLISARMGEGDGRALSKLHAGESFGEMAVLDNEPRSATASAEGTTVVYFISRDDLLSLLERIPRLSSCLVREVSRRLRDFNRHYISETLQAERLSLVGRFARSIVHDLKNPLNIIGIAAELAGMEGATAQSRQSAKERIRKQVDRISGMCNELLEFTRGAQTTFVMAPTDYASFINQVVEEIRTEVALKSVKVVFETQPPSVRVPMNPQRLTRVFHNLMHNATDAMTGGGIITLRFTQSNGEILTEIEDNGPGIAPEVLGKMFEAFVTFGKAHGTGLGLSICKRIVEDHHGKISARNGQSRGAVFSFTLPAQE